jgi:hypothetical protein
MNKLSRNLAPALGFATLAMLACSAPARATSSAVDAELMRMQHEAELQHGEKLLVAHHLHKASSYRFCIPEQPGDISLKVLHDGEVTEVLDGTCETVTGKHIDVVADSKLPKGESLLLKFEKAKA